MNNPSLNLLLGQVIRDFGADSMAGIGIGGSTFRHAALGQPSAPHLVHLIKQNFLLRSSLPNALCSVLRRIVFDPLRFHKARACQPEGIHVLRNKTLIRGIMESLTRLRILLTLIFFREVSNAIL
jgi:hypothetical protein